MATKSDTSGPSQKPKRFRVIAGVFAALLVVALAFGFAFQRQIGMAFLTRGIDAAVGVDRTSALEDGIHVFICGSGSPMPDPTRAGPCLGVVAGEEVFVVDVGSGGARRLARMGFPIGRLERVYLTHLHSDHFDGLGELLLQAWVGGPRTAPLPVAGPPGVEDVVAGLNLAYRVDAGFRTAHHGEAVADPAGFGAIAEIIAPLAADTSGRVLLDQDGLRITLLAAAHAPAEPAYGFRIDYRGRSVVISGDTAQSAALAQAAQGADVLFHDALNAELVQRMQASAQARGQRHIAAIFHDIQDYHATPEQAAETATAAGVDHLVLYHIVPPIPARSLNAAFLGDAPQRFGGPITVAEDGMLVSVPAAGGDVRIRTIR